MAIEEITAYQVRCDHPDHKTDEKFYEGAVTQDGLMTGEYDGPVWFESREQAIDNARGGWGWQVTTAGVFCVEHATDTTPLEQPGPTLVDFDRDLYAVDPLSYELVIDE